MWFKRSFALICIIMSLLLLCSCTKEESDLEIEMFPSDKNLIDLEIETSPPDKSLIDLEIETSPSDKSIIDLASKIYDEPELLELAKFNGSIDELNAQYPIECLREDNSTYRAAYLGNESIAVLLFDNYGNKLLGRVYSIQLLKSDFDSLKEGQSLEEARIIDPNGEYLFLYTGRNDTPKVSSHYTKDGYLITIEYDASNAIISINKNLI